MLQNKESVLKKCFGYADILERIPVSMDTQFLAGSVTKKFTAVAILKALLDKNINESDPIKIKNHIQAELDNKIEHYLPEKHEA